MDVAIERASNGDVPVDALLAALRRAAEQDGVEDVDAVVAEFATFVRAQAPQLASQRAGRRQGGPWTTAALTAGVLMTTALGAVATGVVANPFLSAPDGGGASAEAGESPTVDSPAVGLGSPIGRSTGAIGGVTATSVDPGFDPGPMIFTDPDALAVIAEQREEALAAGIADATDPAGADPADTDPAAEPTGTAPSDGGAPAADAGTTGGPGSTTTTTVPPAIDPDGGATDHAAGPEADPPSDAPTGAVTAPQLAPAGASSDTSPPTPPDAPPTTQPTTPLNDQGGAG